MRLPWRQPRIFISYRRDDSAVHARTIYEGLVDAFSSDTVFFDVEAIEAGDRFAQVIDERMAGCDVLVVVIGPQWATLPGADGTARLQAPADVVRGEIASALRQGKRVIPVAVGGAAPPATSVLPGDIARLAELNALTFSDRQLGEGIDRLVDAIRRKRSVVEVTEAMQRRLAHGTAAAVALAMLLAAWLALFDFFALDTRTTSATLWLADLLAPPEPDPGLRTVVIDEATEAALRKPFRRNPAARRDHAALIAKLAQAGAASVAFDVYFVSPSPADDAVLAAAARAAQAGGTAVVFGAARWRDAPGAAEPEMVPALRQAATAWAMLCVGQRLGLAATVPLASQPAGVPQDRTQAQATGLALAAAWPGPAKIADGTRKVIVSGALGRGIREFSYSELEPVGPGQPCTAGAAGDVVASALHRSVPLSTLQALDRRLKFEAVLAMDAAEATRRFRGATVLVGLEMRDEDRHAVFHGITPEVRPGLSLHADAASALLRGAIVQPVPLPLQFAVMLVLALLGARLQGWQPGGSALPRRLAFGATVLGCIAGAVVLCSSAGWLLNLTYPLGALAAGAFAARRTGLSHKPRRTGALV